jgi:hypothetical protein
MSDCALAAPTTRVAAPGRARRRTRPTGIPRWAWLLGVTMVPLEQRDPDAPPAWVLSAGAGTAHVAALVHDGPADADRVSTRGSGA